MSGSRWGAAWTRTWSISQGATQLDESSCRGSCMRNLVLDLSFGISLELVLTEDGILVARWLWCDLRVGSAEVGMA